MVERDGRALERLEIIIDQIDLIEQQLEAKSFQDFAIDRDVSDLVAYRIHNLGENCHRLSEDLKARHPELPWDDIYGMRNIISHDYGRINPARVWSVAVEHLAAIGAMAGAERVRILAPSERAGSSDVSIVPYRPDHAAAWRSLNEAWLADGGYAIEAKDHRVLGDPDGAILSQGGFIFMAERGGEPVGCCSLMVMADGGYEVGKMAVTPSALGLGLGQRLLQACEAAARAAGAPRLYLETNAAQTHAIALYRRFGFVDLPAQPTPYARCNVWMDKRLTWPGPTGL